jgi:16S rRNA (adenine1518-N6/adenine1519-N6)-dimethyltransferase
MSAYRDQHFLIDPKAVDRIINSTEVCGRTVLEIGPGKGVLTEALLRAGAVVTAVEIDESLLGYLTEHFSDEIDGGRLKLVLGDAARCALPATDLIVANLPYSVSSKILFRVLRMDFSEAVLMFQKEFADRMVARIGSKECGRLSVMVQTYACVQKCFELPPSSFSPPPQVRSAVVKVIPRDPLFPIANKEIYASVVRTLFSHRRKTVRNALKSARGELGDDKVQNAFSRIIPEILDSRAEELYLEDFATISNLVS